MDTSHGTWNVTSDDTLTGYEARDRDGTRCGMVVHEVPGAYPHGHLVVESRSWFVPRLVTVTHTHVLAVDHLRGSVRLDLARHEMPELPEWDPDATATT